jgi:hypothetical protein
MLRPQSAVSADLDGLRTLERQGRLKYCEMYTFHTLGRILSCHARLVVRPPVVITYSAAMAIKQS